MTTSNTPKDHRHGAALGFAAVTILLVTACALLWLTSHFLGRGEIQTASGTNTPDVTIIIDAGHGGMDGGTQSRDGLLEKDINLAVANKLYTLCRLAGIDCRLTRCDDNMLVSDDIKQKRKMHDLKNRAAIADEYASPIFVSIHMNSYPDSRYSGLQVWYSKNDERSRSFASYVQSYAAAYLDPANTRVIKPATSSIYLLDRLQVPAILIECGFLSNENESALLASDDYQTKLALVIFAALCDSISANM